MKICDNNSFQQRRRGENDKNEKKKKWRRSDRRLKSCFMKNGNNLVIMQISIHLFSPAATASSPKAGKFELFPFPFSLSQQEWIKLYRMDERRRRVKEEEDEKVNVNIKFKDYVNFPHFWVLKSVSVNSRGFSINPIYTLRFTLSRPHSKTKTFHQLSRKRIYICCCGFRALVCVLARRKDDKTNRVFLDEEKFVSEHRRKLHIFQDKAEKKHSNKIHILRGLVCWLDKHQQR